MTHYAFPRARTRDPATSHAAALKFTGTACHFQAIYDTLRLYGPAGKDRIAALAQLEPAQVARRLPEMLTLGLVELTGRTVQSRSGRQEREWTFVRKEKS